jgi:RNA polymerase sigma-70 factor (ECF subfamily)
MVSEKMSQTSSPGVSSSVDDASEKELVAGLRSGDSVAFTKTYGLYRARLFGFLIRMTGDRNVAEDLLQETWLRLARHAALLRPETNIGAWLFTVARNLVLSYRRSRFFEEELPLTIIEKPAGEPSPFRTAESSEAAGRLEAAVLSLPTKYREVVLLVGVEGMAPLQAARICHATPDALRQRLARARALLAQKLDAMERKPTVRKGLRK